MRIKNGFFTDDYGRSLILRGCNLGGSSKTPVSDQTPAPLTHPTAVSFVGRPFPLEEADEHFTRLAGWGFTIVRLVITWEALEHGGAGVYDEDVAEKYRIAVYVDPHQDVWSRWTGGDGAPAWTLEKLGMDISKLEAAGAALTEQGAVERGKAFPAMIWPTNYNRYAAATMFTLFYGGKIFAPHCEIDGENAQDFLQERYIAAMRHCYRRLKNCKAIIGWGAMNEPGAGFIGCGDLSRLENYQLAQGAMPSPFQAFTAASGYKTAFPVYTTGLTGEKIIGEQIFEGDSIFTEGFSCPWKREGVWSDEGGELRLLKKDHFALSQGKSFVNDFLKPFINKFAARIREVNENAFVFVEGLPTGTHPVWTKEDAPNAVNAFHWYDGPALFLKRFIPWATVSVAKRRLILGKKNVAVYFAACLAEGTCWACENMSGAPAFLGEFGLPFDLNNRKAFSTHDYRLHEQALSMYYDALDANLLGATIWNYTANNTHERGDGWNGEDLSIFSEGDARARRGWMRPYPIATSGVPLSIRWDRKKAAFLFRFKADASIQEPTEIFLSRELFMGKDICVTLPPPLTSDFFYEQKRLFIYNNGFSGEVEVRVGKN